MQGIQVDGSGNAIQVMCIFTSGSLAMGCRVVVSGNSSIQYTDAVRNDMSSLTALAIVTGLPNGTNWVAALDIEHDGSLANVTQLQYFTSVDIPLPIPAAEESPSPSPTSKLYSL